MALHRPARIDLAVLRWRARRARRNGFTPAVIPYTGYGSTSWVRVLGLLYPTLTLVVIVATANHFWLDAVGGMICLAFGYTVARLWYGSLPYALPQLVPEMPPRRRLLPTKA